MHRVRKRGGRGRAGRGAPREERAGEREAPGRRREHVRVPRVDAPRPREHRVDVRRGAERAGRRREAPPYKLVAEPPVRVPLEPLGPGAGVLRERRRIVAVERRVRARVRVRVRGPVGEAPARPHDARDEAHHEGARPRHHARPRARPPNQLRPRRAARLGRGGVRSDAALRDVVEHAGGPGPGAAGGRPGVGDRQARREPPPRARRGGVRGRRRRARPRVRRAQRLELGVVARPPRPGRGRRLQDLAGRAGRARVSGRSRRADRAREGAPAGAERRRARPLARAAAPQARARLEPARRARDGLDRGAGPGGRVEGRRRGGRPARRAVAAAVGTLGRERRPARDAAALAERQRVVEGRGRARSRRRKRARTLRPRGLRAVRRGAHGKRRLPVLVRQRASPRQCEEGRGREDRDVGAARSACAREQVQEVRRRRAAVGLERARV